MLDLGVIGQDGNALLSEEIVHVFIQFMHPC